MTKQNKPTISEDRIDELAKEAIERMAVDNAQRFDFKDCYAANYVYYKAIREERLKIQSVTFCHEDNVKAITERMKKLRKDGYKPIGLAVFKKKEEIEVVE